MIYLDYAAAAPMTAAARDAFAAASEIVGNPAAAHALGRKLHDDIEVERAFLASLLEAAAFSAAPESDESDLARSDLDVWTKQDAAFIFCSSLTEANNMIWRGLTLRPADEIFFSPADHPSLTKAQEFYQAMPEIKVRPLPLMRGRLDETAFYAQLGPQTKLVLLSSVNNTCGLINPVERWSWEIKRRAPQALIHLDHGQGFLKHPLGAHCLDSMAVPSTKIGGPGGIAGLWVRQRKNWRPWLYGGGHEYNLRSSSLAYPLIKAFAAAVRTQVPHLAEQVKQTAALKQSFQQSLRQQVPEVRFPVEEVDSTTPTANFSPLITLALFPKVSSDILMRYLEREEIMVAASSACSSHVKGFDPVLAALGLAAECHKNVLRFSWSANHSAQDLHTVAERVAIHYRALAKFAGR